MSRSQPTCNDCGVNLIVGTNWTNNQKINHSYVCRSCRSARNYPTKEQIESRGTYRQERMNTSEDPHKRFENFVNKDGPVHPVLGKCHIWTGATDKDGYGRFRLDGEHVSEPAFRVAYIWEYGSLPKGFVPDHLCLVKLCVRPSHLESVSVTINNSRAHRKVEERQLIMIRQLLVEDDLSQTEIASIVGVSQGTVWNVKHSVYLYMQE